ncbi:MAG: hypothetical protein QM820_43275 [Minicystis sp.]
MDDIVLPYAGVVYTPNDLWEFRLLFPKPRISYFLGTPNGVATWVYVQAEYHVEAYQVDTYPGRGQDRVQIADWRVVGGMRFEAGWLTTFVEAGYVFDRKVEFREGRDGLRCRRHLHRPCRLAVLVETGAPRSPCSAQGESAARRRFFVRGTAQHRCAASLTCAV